MQLRRLRYVVWATAIALSLGMLLVPIVSAQDPGPVKGPTPSEPGPATTLEQALCQLWSPEEVARVLGGEVQASPDFGRCSWSPLDASGPWMQLSAAWWDNTLEDQEAISADGHELAVGPATAWYDDVTDTLYLPFSDGLLSISVQRAYSEDPESGAAALGELALSRSTPLPAAPTQPPPTATEVAFCALWTIEEVSEAVGGEVEALPGFDACFWFATDPDGPPVAVSVSWDTWTLADRKDAFPDGREVAVGSGTGWYDDVLGLWVPAGDGLLSVSATAAPGLDSESVSVSLAELALSRLAALPAPPSPYPTEEPLPSVAPTPVSGRADAFCGLLTPDEVGQLLGGAEVVAIPRGEACAWEGTDATGEYVSWYAQWAESTFEELRSHFPNGRSIGVGPLNGWYEDHFGLLYVPLDRGVLSTGILAATGVDQEAAITSLGELVIARIGSVPAPPTPAPTETPTGDPELEAMLPETVGGESLFGYSSRGPQQYASMPPEALESLTEALGVLGKSLDDVSTVWRSTQIGDVRINAIRIRGADITAVVPLLIEHSFTGMAMTQTPSSVDGKPVTVMSTTEGKPYYVYPSGDTLWIVWADETRLSEIFASLP